MNLSHTRACAIVLPGYHPEPLLVLGTTSIVFSPHETSQIVHKVVDGVFDSFQILYVASSIHDPVMEDEHRNYPSLDGPIRVRTPTSRHHLLRLQWLQEDLLSEFALRRTETSRYTVPFTFSNCFPLRSCFSSFDLVSERQHLLHVVELAFGRFLFVDSPQETCHDLFVQEGEFFGARKQRSS